MNEKYLCFLLVLFKTQRKRLDAFTFNKLFNKLSSNIFITQQLPTLDLNNKQDMFGGVLDDIVRLNCGNKMPQLLLSLTKIDFPPKFTQPIINI